MQTQENYHTRTFERLLATNHYTFDLTLSKEVALLAVLFLLGFLVRLSAIQSNTLYVDEIIYINAGRNYLAGDFSQNELNFMFGSYLFPITAALAEIPAGALSLRVYSVSLNLISSVLLYLLARQLFGRSAALWALILFMFSGISMSLSLQAVHDSLAVPFVIAALYCITLATYRKERAIVFGVLAGLCFSIAVLAKFSVAGTLPALLVLLALFSAYAPSRLGQAFRQTTLWLTGMTALIVGVYTLRTSEATLQAVAAYNQQEIAGRLTILQRTFSDLGIVAILAIFGIALLVYRLYKNSRQEARDRIWHILFALAVAATLFMLQAYHVISANARSLWQHNAITLALLAPFAGFALKQIADWFVKEDRLSNKPLRWLAYAGVIVVVVFFSQTSLNAFEVFQRSWPDVTAVVENLREDGVADPVTSDENGIRVLAAAAPVYQYYLSPQQSTPPWWTTWFFVYEEQTGLDAMIAAVQDCALDVVILDNYFAADLVAPLQESLLTAGYANTFTDRQVLGYGAVIDVQVFRPGVSAECSKRVTDEL